MELRGRRANKPQSGLFSRHYYSAVFSLAQAFSYRESPPVKRTAPAGGGIRQARSRFLIGVLSRVLFTRRSGCGAA